MIKNQRQQDIINIVQQKEYVTVEYLAKVTFSSLPTIRRDLSYLDQSGYLIRTHGGAMLPNKENSILPIDFRKTSHSEQKKQLCKKASEFLSDFETIFIDESSTTSFIVEYLSKFKDIMVITNGFFTCANLLKLDIPFFCTGGKLSNKNCFSGTLAQDAVKQFNADITFFSAGGLTKEGLITSVSENEIAITQAMLSHSKIHILLCDQNKINRSYRYVVTDIDNVDYVITNSNELNIPKNKLIYVPTKN